MTINSEAQINKNIQGKWEYKGRNEETHRPIHLIYEFKGDIIIEKGYLNKRDFIITKGRIVENLGKNKVKIELGTSYLNGIENLEVMNSFWKITITLITEKLIKIKMVGEPSIYDPKPSEDEYLFKKVR